MHPDPTEAPSPSSPVNGSVPHGHTPDAAATYLEDVLAARKAKDDIFSRSLHSPIPRDRRPEFLGLAYFPPDPSYRLVGLELEPVSDDERRSFAIETSDRRPRTAHRLGRLRFVLAGQELTLTAYRVGGDGSGSLFIPFTDGTSGRGTYGAGRYLDIEPRADGTYVLDFNDAYHPYCVYSDAYSCPLPPAENRLALPIEAGERLGAIYRTGRHG